MPKQIITSSSAPTTGFTPGAGVSPLAQAIRFGNTLFVSGQGSLDPTTGVVVQGDIAEQTRQTLDNLMSILEAAAQRRRTSSTCALFFGMWPIFRASMTPFATILPARRLRGPALAACCTAPVLMSRSIALPCSTSGESVAKNIRRSASGNLLNRNAQAVLSRAKRWEATRANKLGLTCACYRRSLPASGLSVRR